MEEMPVRDRIDCMEQIFEDRVSQIFPMEYAVPDTMPDIGTILMADGDVCIRSGAVSAGCVTLEGSIQGTVIYTGADAAAPSRVNMTLPVVITVQDPAIMENDRLVFRADLTGAEARPQNGRQLSFRAEVTACVKVYRPGCIDLSADTEDIEQPETLPGEAELGFLLDIREKTFTVADEADLQTPIEQLLWYHADFFAESAKKAGGKTVIQGGAELSVLYLPPDSDIPCGESFRIPFSQIMDAPDGDYTVTAVHFQQAACYMDILPGLNRSDTVSVEIQLSAKVLYIGEKRTPYTMDMYSLRCPLTIQSETRTLTGPYSCSARKTAVRELIELPEQAAEVICTNVRLSPCAFTDEGIRTTASVSILYRSESGLRSVSRKLPVEFCGDLAGISFISCNAVCGDVFTSVQNDGILLQFDAELDAVSAGMQIVTYISSARRCDDPGIKTGERPSIVAVRPGERSLWELAKTYHSTIRLIEAANPAERSADSLLLIPKGR